ncbi:MAG: cytochrome o ubiquinol oxidase subunit III [Salinisphaera sp.]|nr:cytochrome o ubiquinol oxidase subunit III [Salinisphaera sp.]
MNTTASAAMGDMTTPFHVMTEDHPENGVHLGFWLYLMSDSFIFISLFACYAIYAFGGHFAGGPQPGEVFELGFLAVSTGALLLSSLTYGFGMLELARKRKAAVLAWLAVAGVFALVFLGLEIKEFAHLIEEGFGPSRSAFLSSFFTLVGTHGLHVTMGMVWLITLMTQVAIHGLTPDNSRRLTCLSLYWHFLDLVWIGIFSFVYLIGVLP